MDVHRLDAHRASGPARGAPFGTSFASPSRALSPAGSSVVADILTQVSAKSPSSSVAPPKAKKPKLTSSTVASPAVPAYEESPDIPQLFFRAAVVDRKLVLQCLVLQQYFTLVLQTALLYCRLLSHDRPLVQVRSRQGGMAHRILGDGHAKERRAHSVGSDEVGPDCR